MGSGAVAALDAEGACAARALARVPRWFEVWTGRLGRFVEDSELCRLNLSAGRPFRASGDLVAALEASLRAARATGGLVVPTVLPALEAAGYDKSFERLRRAAARPGPAEGGAWRAIRVDARRRIIRLRGDVRVDLGGVAKGWAADQATSRLARLGPALVEVGGDLAISRPQRDGERWPVGVSPPWDGREGDAEPLEILLLGRGGVATSGRDFRRWRAGGRWQHHIIDPRTGAPARTEVLTATVVAPTATEAEVAAKAALILGPRAGLAFIEARPRLAGLLVLECGRVLRSRRLARLTA